MSKHINVNPDHYKVAGRERPGEDIDHRQNKRELAMENKALKRQRGRTAATGTRARRKSPSPPARSR
jgi:hypothetical protein